jgi:hypothetical protein
MDDQSRLPARGATRCFSCSQKKDKLRVSIHIQLRSAAGIRLCCDFLPEACWRKNNVSFSAGWELSE